MRLGTLIRRMVVIGLAVAALAGCSSPHANPELRHRVNLDATPTQTDQTSIFELTSIEATGLGRHDALLLQQKGPSIFTLACRAGAEKRDYSDYRWFLVRMPQSPRLWVIMNTFMMGGSHPIEAHDSFESWDEAEWYLTLAASHGRIHVWNHTGPIMGSGFTGFSEAELTRREDDGRWTPPRFLPKSP